MHTLKHSNTHTHTRTRASTHTRAHTQTQAHTYKQKLYKHTLVTTVCFTLFLASKKADLRKPLYKLTGSTKYGIVFLVNSTLFGVMSPYPPAHIFISG